MNKDQLRSHLATLENNTRYMVTLSNYLSERVMEKLFKSLLFEQGLIIDAVDTSNKKEIANWINIYVSECDFGKKPQEVFIDNEKHVINNFNALWEILKVYL